MHVVTVEEVMVNRDDDGFGDVAEPELLDTERRPGPLRPSAAWLRDWVVWFGPVRLLACAAAAVAVAFAGWWLVRSPPEPTEAALPVAGSPPTTVTATAANGTAPPWAAGGEQPSGHAPPGAAAGAPAAPDGSVPPVDLTVHVTGAVRSPGVYQLPQGSRIHEAIDIAGGFTRRADASALNLAATLADGSQVYVPEPGEEIPEVAAPRLDPNGNGAAADPATADGVDGVLVNVNTADQDQLESLPGIGPVTAQAIIDHREAVGGFSSPDDLEEVRGIGPATLAAIYDLVTV